MKLHIKQLTREAFISFYGLFRPIKFCRNRWLSFSEVKILRRSFLRFFESLIIFSQNFLCRVESSSTSPNSQQKAAYNKNYYNASNTYNPPSYDSYYTVYDDDVELYRDSGMKIFLYTSENTQKEKKLLDYQPQPQYNSNKQTVSSTYRPTVVTPSTLSTQRESYATQRPQTTYHASSPVYDYDDALVAQVSTIKNKF